MAFDAVGALSAVASAGLPSDPFQPLAVAPQAFPLRTSSQSSLNWHMPMEEGSTPPSFLPLLQWR